MDVSGRILRTWMPAIHAGMTTLSIFMLWGRAQGRGSLRGKISLSTLVAALPFQRLGKLSSVSMLSRRIEEK
jgi:hypothetical protein